MSLNPRFANLLLSDEDTHLQQRVLSGPPGGRLLLSPLTTRSRTSAAFFFDDLHVVAFTHIP